MLNFIVWLLAIEAIGLAAFPICHYLFPSLKDRGYSISKAFGLLVIGSIFGAALAESFDQNVGRWYSLINISFTPTYLNDIIFDQPSSITENNASAALPNVVKVFWYIAWTAGPGLILWRRYRALVP